MKIDIKRILCPTDFSASADHALQYAFAIAERHGATVEVLHVAQSSAYTKEREYEFDCQDHTSCV